MATKAEHKRRIRLVKAGEWNETWITLDDEVDNTYTVFADTCSVSEDGVLVITVAGGTIYTDIDLVIKAVH